MVYLKRLLLSLSLLAIATTASAQTFPGLVTTDRILGRDTAGTGQVEQLTVGGALSFTGSGGITATGANILAQLLTVDGSGSGLDADLLDGVSSAGFLQDFNFTDDASTAGLAITEAETMTFAGDTAGIDTAGSGNTLTISFDITEAEANIESAIDTLANLTSIQSLTVTLADAGADAVFGWDDSAAAYENLTAAEVLAVIEASTPLLTEAEAAAAYQPLDADLTSWAGVTRASGFDTWVATPSSANLDTLVTDDTGSGALVFGTSPTLATATIELGADLDANGNNIDDGGVIFLIEQAAADADVAGSGQWWVQTATPNLPMFTNDAGTDFQLATLAGTETLTNKTLTSPTIGTSPTAAGATWTDLGSVTTADINGGTIDGVTMGSTNELAIGATTESNIEAAIDTLANLVSIQSLTVTLADAGANAFFGWDDTAGAYENLTGAEAEAIIEPLIDTLANLTSIQGVSFTFGSYAATLLNNTSESGFKQAVNLEIGVDVQAFDADLTTLSTAFTTASGTGAASLAFHEDTDNGTNRVLLQGAASTADVTLTLQATTGTVYSSGGTDVAVADGGTGASTASGGFDALSEVTSSTAGKSILDFADTGADAIIGWDDSAGQLEDLTVAEVLAVIEAVTPIVTQAEGDAAYQPLDADLTSIAALTTTAAGRDCLTMADSALDEVVAWDDSAGACETIALADITTEAAPAAGDYVLIYGAEGDLRKVNWSGLPGAGGGISNVVEDTTPQLGGDLDLNDFQLVNATTDNVFDMSLDGFPTLTTTTAAGGLVISSDQDAENGGYLYLWLDSASPADNDFGGGIAFQHRNDAAQFWNAGVIYSQALDVTDGTEDGSIGFDVMIGGSQLTALTLGASTEDGFHQFRVPTGNYYAIAAISADSDDSGSSGFDVFLDSSTPADNDYIGFWTFTGNNDAAERVNYAFLDGWARDVTDGTEDGQLDFGVMVGGSRLTALTLGGTTATFSSFGHTFDLGATNFATVEVTNTSADDGGPYYSTYANSATPAIADFLGGLIMYGEDSAGNLQRYAGLQTRLLDPTSTSEDSRVDIDFYRGGANISYVLSGSIAKAWSKSTQSSTTVLDNENVASVADTAAGRLTVTIGTDMIDGDYAAMVNAEHNSASGTTQTYQIDAGSMAAGSIILESWQVDGTEALTDPTASWLFTAHGN